MTIKTEKNLQKTNFLANNPDAKQLDEAIDKIKKAISAGNEDLLKKLLDLDPKFKTSLRKLLEG